MLRALLACLLSLPCLAQVVHVANYSGSEFEGWKRATIDVAPPHPAGQVGDVRYVLGRAIGVDARVVDLRIHLDPGEIRSIDLSTAVAMPFELAPLPGEPLAFFGAPSIGGVPFRVIEAKPDGAARSAHLRAKPTRMLCADLWVAWYPDQPSWASSEIVVTASNNAIEDMTAEVPKGFDLKFGDADVLGFNLPAGEMFGDGQARSFPLVFIWRQHLNDVREWASAAAAASMGICANGISKLWPDGNPAPLANPLAWTRANWAGAVARLRGWETGSLGPNKRSADTGAQEDQVFVGGECVGIASLGAETIRYLVALGQSRQPCHHLEPVGDQLYLDQHRYLVMWSGRPHYLKTVSPDQLGKLRSQTKLETHGWSGPDREHWLINTLAIAYRLTGSPALQWQLESHARIFWFQETTDPRLSTSNFSTERAIGWAGIVAVHLWRSLEDRALALKIQQRWQDRVRMVYIPKLSIKPQDIWLPRNDTRLTNDTGWVPLNWMPYQQAVGAWGLDYACRLIGPPAGRELALKGARATMLAWQHMDDDTWKPWAYRGFSGAGDPVPFVEHGGAHFGENVWVWMMLGAATVLDHEPQNAQAQAVWTQSSRAVDPKWIPVAKTAEPK